MSAAVGLLYSQIGYDLGWPMRAVVRGPDETLLSPDATFQLWKDDSPAFAGPVLSCGTKWGSHWWAADFSDMAEPGSFVLTIRDGGGERFRSAPFEAGHDLLWRTTWRIVALDQNERRARLAMNGVGWQDCGASWQEANSHAALLVGLSDLLEFARPRIPAAELDRLEAQVVTGCDYLALLQDRAAELGKPAGSLSHQKPKFEETVLPSDAAKAAVVWARASRFLSGKQAAGKCSYRLRAARALDWALCAPPPSGGFAHSNHGAPEDFAVPREPMTRDLLMMCWAAFELAMCGEEKYSAVAADLARRVMSRQVPQARAEGGLFGHFYTFDECGFTEKSWVHNLDQGRIGADAGGHFPHYLIPLLRMREAWPDHPDAPEWSRAVRDFAYGYFLPACRANPFLLLPLGYFKDAGLLWFSGLWHGMNAAYGLAAALAREFELAFVDPAFREIVAGNLQWIAGLNAGLTADGLFASHMFSAEIPPDVALPVSMIHGIGRCTAGTWLNVRGSICNGFSTGDQFRFDVAPGIGTDGPLTFTDEDWITHSGAWLSALARLG